MQLSTYWSRLMYFFSLLAIQKKKIFSIGKYKRTRELGWKCCSGGLGVPEINNSSLTLQEALKDDTRIQYYHDHLLSLLSALRYELPSSRLWIYLRFPVVNNIAFSFTGMEQMWKDTLRGRFLMILSGQAGTRFASGYTLWTTMMDWSDILRILHIGSRSSLKNEHEPDASDKDCKSAMSRNNSRLVCMV